jgi:peptidoglycan/xylan/chitin deacetylase (PgdA/CDA1 family)
VRPTLVISLDKELIWGSFDHTSPEVFAARNPDPRGIVARLLRLLDEREVPATWAVVGHLFLSSCDRGPEGPHPELVRPTHRWYRGDWLQADPCTNRAKDPLWYGDDIVEAILGARTPQEIGCHSFSHMVFGDPGCSAEAADSDLAACVDVARARGITLRSFVFPRNAEGHHDLLRRHGFIAFRGEDPTWFRSLPGFGRRAGHFLDEMTGVPPPVASPREALPGLWDLPGSMIFMPRGGVRRVIPLAARVRKARAGLARAQREGKIFHLWFHPFNLASDPRGLFQALTAIVDEAVTLRDRGELDIRTMGDIACELNEQRAGAGATGP